MSMKDEIRKIQENAQEIKKLADEILNDRENQLEALSKPSVVSEQELFTLIISILVGSQYSQVLTAEQENKLGLQISNAVHNLITKEGNKVEYFYKERRKNEKIL